MKYTTTSFVRCLLLTIFAMLLAVSSISAGPIFRVASGNAAAIQSSIAQFRLDLGGVNNGVGNSYTTGRREINWDDVPNASSSPNFLAYDFFNVISPRGVIFNSISEEGSGGAQNRFLVSANAGSGTPVRFGNINASYSSIFTTFSGQRIFAPSNASNIQITFFVPGTKIPATVSGFGAVLCNVTPSFPRDNTVVRYYAADGSQLLAGVVFGSNELSFLGVSFDEGERVAKVVIELGSNALSPTAVNGVNDVDVVAMDDFIYGEPRAAQYHTGDFDGDGSTDSTVYRPGTGTWFTLNSGSNTVTQEHFGLNGDIPVDGDFDGDQRADLAIFRPSDGTWFFKRSSNGTTLGAQFGQNGDKPVVGDYDKDGKSDIAIWRPANGNYFVLRSSSDFSNFFSYPFGQNGDIPIQGGAQ